MEQSGQIGREVFRSRQTCQDASVESKQTNSDTGHITHALKLYQPTFKFFFHTFGANTRLTKEATDHQFCTLRF